MNELNVWELKELRDDSELHMAENIAFKIGAREICGKYDELF